MEKIAAFLLVEKKQKKQKLVKCSAPLTTDLPLTLDPLRREKKMKNEKWQLKKRGLDLLWFIGKIEEKQKIENTIRIAIVRAFGSRECNIEIM